MKLNTYLFKFRVIVLFSQLRFLILKSIFLLPFFSTRVAGFPLNMQTSYSVTWLTYFTLSYHSASVPSGHFHISLPSLAHLYNPHPVPIDTPPLHDLHGSLSPLYHCFLLILAQLWLHIICWMKMKVTNLWNATEIFRPATNTPPRPSGPPPESPPADIFPVATGEIVCPAWVQSNDSALHWSWHL